MYEFLDKLTFNTFRVKSNRDFINHPLFRIDENDNFEVWGVVIWTIPL